MSIPSSPPAHLHAAVGIRHTAWRWSSRCLLAWLLLVAAASACSIPVFRYALERWRPDPYEVLVFHRGELTSGQSELLQRLGPQYVPGEPTPNVALSKVDLDGKVRPEFDAIWQSDGGETLPWLVVRTPWKGENFTVWKGPLTAESLPVIHASPMRAELIRRLIGGDSIVWVLLEGTNSAQADELEQTCLKELARLQTEIRLPEIRPEDLTSLSVDPDKLGLKFSLLRLKADNADEQLLIRSLLTVKPGLSDAVTAGEPLLFPIFGRGRIFFPLVGKEIAPVNLEDLARFLSGACQCTIKEQNPGTDLLTTVDWDAYVLGIETERPLPPLAGLGGFATAIQPLDHGAETSSAGGASVETVGLDPSSESPIVAPHSAESAATAAVTNRGLPVVSAPVSTATDSNADLGNVSLLVLGLLAAGVAVLSLWFIPRGR